MAGIGTGGTVVGVGKYLKAKNPKVQIVAVDPVGSIVRDFFYTGDFPDPARDPYYFPKHENATKYHGILEDLKKGLSTQQKEKLAFKNVERFIASNWT